MPVVSTCRSLFKSKASWVGLRCVVLSRSSRRRTISSRKGDANHPVRALFTGIVEELGTVADVGTVEDGFEMTINASVALDGVKLGDSIAVNGTCLTVTRFDDNSFSVGLAPETLRRTSLGDVVPGSLVNLERSLQPTSRLGGHFVQGHVDGTGTIVSMDKEKDSLWVKVKTSADILRYIVPKGYIAVDGTSLTVVNVFDDELAFNFMLVSYTQQKIVVPLKSVGSKVNLEVDIMGKYVERLLAGYTTRPAQT
ncbi:hypothetical protein KP509_16G051300 [Ceratopteris richardii]|nr:hypothetical protein KP509_16G051300 [Ceratopteris richardii]